MPWYEPATLAVSTASSLARRTWLPWTSSTTSRMSDADGDAVAPADGLVLVVPTVAVGECTEPAGEAPPQAASSTTATAALKAVPLNLRLMMRKRGSPGSVTGVALTRPSHQPRAQGTFIRLYGFFGVTRRSPSE